MREFLNIPSPWKGILLPLFLIFFASSQGYALDVALQWDANTEPDLAGYKVYYGTDSGGPYECQDAANGPSPITLTINNPGDPCNLDDPDNTEYKLTGYTGVNPCGDFL